MNVMKTKLNAGLEFSNQHSWILGKNKFNERTLFFNMNKCATKFASLL